MAKAKAKTAPAVGSRRVTTVEETVEEGATGAELDLENEGQPEDEGDDFLSVLDEIGGGAESKCEIRRTSPAEFAGYCCTYPRSEMSLDRLQAEWGGGKFNVRVRDARGVFRGSTSIQIAGKPRHRDDSQTTPTAAPAPAAPAVDVGAIVAAATAGTQAQVAMLSEMVKALINKPEPVKEKSPSTLEVITALAPILRPEKSSDSGDAIKLFMQGLELGKDLGGSGDGDGGMLSLASKGLDMVKTMAAQQPRQVVRPRPQPARVLAPPPPETQGTVPAQEPPAAQPPQEVTPMVKLLAFIKQQAKLLSYQAAHNKDPGLYADLFLDNIPTGFTIEQVHERFSKDTAIKDFAEASGNPDVLKFPQWMEAFRLAVLERITDDADADAGASGEVIDHEAAGDDNAAGEGS